MLESKKAINFFGTLQCLLELEESGAWMADHLTPFVDEVDPGHAARAHDDDFAIIIAAVGCRAARDAGIGGLHDDDLVRRGAGLQHSPLLDEVAWPNDGQCRPRSESEARAVTARAFRTRQHIATPDDRPQLIEKAGIVASRIVARSVDTDRSGCHGHGSFSVPIMAGRWPDLASKDAVADRGVEQH